MTEHEGQAYQDSLANLENMLGIREECSHNCCVCGRETYHEPDMYGDYYCSAVCYTKDTGIKITCLDCGKQNCRCCWEDFFNGV